MIQRREHFGFALKTRQAIGIVRESGRQNLDGDVTLQACVTRAIHLAHAARAEHRVDFVRTETRTAFERHCVRILSGIAQLVSRRRRSTKIRSHESAA